LAQTAAIRPDRASRAKLSRHRRRIVPSRGCLPGGGFTGVEHIHPHQDEHFEVLAGQAAFSIEGVERVVGAGHTVDVPGGTKHTFRNAGDDEMRVVAEFRPAPESTERFYELYFGFAQEGRVNSSKGTDRSR
jgi:mannose-6-phosphate isomerase-like protein (cupin superfamily)